MTLSDLLLLLRQDLRQTFRVTGRTGPRTKKKSRLRSAFYPIFAVIIGAIIFLAVVWIAPLFWSDIVILLRENLGLGATIFNMILLFAFIGSIMISATTVGNSSKMEYLLVMPLRMRTVFLEKTIIIIFYNSMIWLVIGTPIFLGLSVVAGTPIALLSGPAFVILCLILVTVGVSLGGLLGLLFSRLLAGRRTLKQVGYFFLSTLAIVVSVFWYYSFYFSDEGSFIFDALFQIADMLGLSSHLSPGYTVSAISLGLLVGAPLGIADILATFLFLGLGVFLVLGNAYVSEMAHYSGWLASGSKRSSKSPVPIVREPWNPISLPFVKLNTTTSVSLWYNITSIRREGRVLAQYTMGPMRYVILIILSGLYAGSEVAILLPFILVAALIPFATSYGLSFAGYELAYEGKNLMNLQLAAANMTDYVKGKVYSAIPFVLGATTVMSILMIVLAPEFLVFIPALVIGCLFVNLAAGAMAANVAAKSGDFKADRMITRQRGANVRPPIRGWGILRASILPNIIAYIGIFSVLGVGVFFGPVFSYMALVGFALLCYILFKNYASSAGRRLIEIEATEYL